MEKHPLVSICIPTYNGVQFLSACLDSVLSQTFADFEVIVVDDLSGDGTAALVETYVNKDQRIRFYKNEKNLGLVGNWNKCLELAQGAWIKFVFQDDYLDKDCIQIFVDNCATSNGLLVSKRSFILPDTATEAVKNYYYKEVRTLENTGALSLGFNVPPARVSRISVENIALNFIGEPSLTFFRKGLIEKYGVFNGALSQICDLEFFLRLATSQGLTYIPKQICHFRIHSDSTTSQNLNQKLYILSHLEPIVLVRQMLFASVYENLRRSLSWREMFKLKYYFNVRSYEAHLNSKAAEVNKQMYSLRSSEFPEIATAGKGTIGVKLILLMIQIRRLIRKFI